MANNRLILRTLNSPWVVPAPDLTKGSVLSHADLDNNFIYLKGEDIYSVSIAPGVATLNRVNGGTLSIPFSAAGNTYTSGVTVTGNVLEFNRNDVLSAYTVDLSGILSGVTLTDGNGTTASGSSADLGGILYKDATIDGAGAYKIDLGKDVLNENLTEFNINSVASTEKYSSGAYPFALSGSSGLKIFKNAGNYSEVMNIIANTTSERFLGPSGSSMKVTNTGTNERFTYSVNDGNFISEAINTVNGNKILVTQDIDYFSINAVTSGTGVMNFTVDRFNETTEFLDTRTVTRGIEYNSDYSSGYSPRSLITKHDLDAAITGITSGITNNTFVTGFTYDNANTFTIFQNNGKSPLTATINTITGLTVNGVISATTINALTVSATTVNATTVSATTVNATTVSATTVNATTVNSTTILSGGTNITNIFATTGNTSGLQTQITNNFNNITTLSGDVTTIQGDIISGGTYNSSTDEITLYQNDGGTIVITGATGGGGIYTTGSTILNNIVYYDRTDSLSAYTTDLSQFTSGLTTSNLALDNLIQDPETRTYDMNNQTLIFDNGFMEVTDTGFTDTVHFEHGGGELSFGGVNGTAGIGGGGSNLLHDTKFNTASSTINCHRDFANDVGLCLINYTTAGGLNDYAVVENKDGPLYVVSSSGNTLLFQSGSNDFAWLDAGGGTDMLLQSGVLSVATWEGVVVKEAFGGTAQSTYATGDMLYASAANTLSKLSAGTNTDILTMVGGIPTWAANAAGQDTFITGFTYDNANTLTIVRNDLTSFTATINTMTGLTVTGTISATTIDASAILSGGTNISNLFAPIGSSLNTFVTGYTYDNANTFTILQKDGEADLLATINTVTGLTVNGTLSATTVNAGDIFSGGTNLSTIINNAAGANTFTTGFTYDNANTFTISRNDGQPDLDATINNMTGLTVNGTISATTVDAVNLTATTVNATTIFSGGTNLSTIINNATGTDADAVHVNVLGEISAITEKTSVDNQDLFIIEDSDNSFNKKSIKRINVIRPIDSSFGTASAITPDSDEYDQITITNLSDTSIAINKPTAGGGTPTNGQKLVFRIQDDGTPRTLNWNAAYEPIGVTLPNPTTAGKKIYVGCIYNSTDDTWDVVAVNVEA